MTSLSAVLANSRRRSGHYVTALSAFGTLLVSVQAHAQDAERVELTWQAPAGCPSVDSVRARIRELAGASSANDARLRAEGTVTRSSDGRFHLELRVHTDDATGVRHIEAASCEDLAGAAAVNLVLLLGSSTTNTRAPPSSEAGAEPSSGATTAIGRDASSSQPAAAATIPQPDSNASQDATASESDRANPREWRLLLRLPLAGFGIGLLPKPSFGLAFGAGLRLDGWTFLAEAAAWLRQNVPATSRMGVSANVNHIDAGLRTCHTFRWPGFALEPCVSLMLRHVWAQGSGDRVTGRTADSTWVAPGIGAYAHLPVTEWLSLITGLDVQLETAHPRISIEGVGEIDQLGAVSVNFAAGVEWNL